MRILALVPGPIDEQILFFPTLEDIKRQYAQAAIDVIVEPRAKAAYRVCQHVHEVLTFDYKDKISLADYLNLLGTIRDREYDAVLSLSQDWAIELLLWLNGIPVRVGYKTNKSWFLSNPVPLKIEQYAAYMYHDLLPGMGIQSPCPELKVTVPKADIDSVEAAQKQLEIKDSGYILIYDNSGSSTEPESYPLPQWQRIVEDIQRKQPDIPVVLLESWQNGSWIAQMKQACPTLKKISPPDIGKLAASIAGANLMLCTDSTPMYLSVAVGTYTIALFGSTNAKKRLPPNSDRYLGIQSPTKSIADIQPETILHQIWRG